MTQARFEKYVEIDVNASFDLDFDVKVDVVKNTDIKIDIDVDADVKGNTAELNLNLEAYGADTYTQADIVMFTTDDLSSLTLYAVSVTA